MLFFVSDTSFFKLLNGDNVSNFNFQWNSTPQSIGECFICKYTRGRREEKGVGREKDMGREGGNGVGKGSGKGEYRVGRKGAWGSKMG